MGYAVEPLADHVHCGADGMDEAERVKARAGAAAQMALDRQAHQRKPGPRDRTGGWTCAGGWEK
jgi:hypothetical protein